VKRIEELIRLRAEGKGGYPAWQDCPLTKCPVFRECVKDCCQVLKAIQDMEKEATDGV